MSGSETAETFVRAEFGNAEGTVVCAYFESGPPWAVSPDDPRLNGAEIAPFAGTGAPVPSEVSLKQLLFALRDGGWITHDEALAAARTGALPATLATTLADAVAAGTLPLSAADDAALTWAAMCAAERRSGLWALLVSAGKATEAQVDDVFRRAVTYTA